MFRVSVIIPMYNAEHYIEQAIRSACQLDEVGEVIVVDDCYPDGARAICERLSKELPQLSIHDHPDKKNHGAGASRNLGVSKSKFDYIAFLDADDYYLPNRFKQSARVFGQYSDADGTYGSTGSVCEDEVRDKYKEEVITTVDTLLAPVQLFWNLAPIGNKGYFSTDAITLKKSAFLKVGGFNTNLSLAQDTNLWVKLMIACKLYPDSIDEHVAIRRLHSANRHTNKDKAIYYRPLVYRDLVKWSIWNGIGWDYLSILCYRFMLTRIKSIRLLKPKDLFRYGILEIPHYLFCTIFISMTFPFLLYYLLIERKK